jgi:hypothetical protein
MSRTSWDWFWVGAIAAQLLSIAIATVIERYYRRQRDRDDRG